MNTTRKYLTAEEVAKYRALKATARAEIVRELAQSQTPCGMSHVLNILRGATPSDGDTAKAVLRIADKKLKKN